MVLYMHGNISYKVYDNGKEPERMEKYMASEMELLEKTIDQFIALQRIKNAQDPMKEVEYQLAIVKAKLESFGVVVENLNLE